MGGAGTAYGAVVGSALLEVIRNALLMAGIDFELAGRLRRRLHHSRGPDRNGDARLQPPGPDAAHVPFRPGPLEPPPGNPRHEQGRKDLKKTVGNRRPSPWRARGRRLDGAGAEHLRAGAEEHEQSVLRPGARRLQEGGSGIERQASSACTSAPASTAAATSRCRSSRTSSPAATSRASRVSPANAAAMAVALQAAKDAGIPVLTWDTDMLPENQDLRARLHRHAQLRDRRQPRQARPWRSSRRAARSASSRAARRRPTTTSACRASATRWRGIEPGTPRPASG